MVYCTKENKHSNNWSDGRNFSPYPTGPPANIVLVKNVLSFIGILLAMMFVNDG